MAELALTLNVKLSCGQCDDILLWIHNPTLLVQNVGVTDPDLINPFIEGDIVGVVCDQQGNYVYTVSYDENDLVTPADLLTECDVREICCAGCAIAYLQILINNINDVIAALDARVTANEATLADHEIRITALEAP